MDIGGSMEAAGRAELSAVLERMAASVAGLCLRDAEVDELLLVGPGDWARYRDRDAVPPAAAEQRIRYWIDMAKAADTLLGGEVQVVVWLRTINGALGGRPPLDVLLSEPAALGSLRRLLMTEVEEKERWS